VKRFRKIKIEKNHLIAVISIILFAVFSGVIINYLSKEIKLGVLAALLVLSACLITLFLTNRLYKKVYKKLIEKGRECIGEFQVKDYDNKIFAVMEEITEKYCDLKRKNAAAKNSINDLFLSLQSLSETGYQSINKLFESLDSISMPLNQQAAALDEGTNFVKKLSEHMDSISDNFNSVRTDTLNIKELCSTGLNSINLLKEKFQLTIEMTDQITESVRNFTDIIKSVSEFVDIMSDISKQTKHLALNATIEAAKAGKYGSGFAVVAGNFKKLSDQAQNHTVGISQLMDKIVRGYADINRSVEDLKESIKNQTESVEDTNQSFHNITDAVFSISKEINDVNISLDKMRIDKDEMIKLMEETAVFAKQTVAASEEFASVVDCHGQTVSDIIGAIQSTKNTLTETIND